MRIDVFTPLPPQRTEIANHSQSVLRALSARCDVFAWTTEADAACAGLHPRQIRRYDPADLPLPELHGSDAVFYNLGNHAGFHRAILQAAMAVPGVVVLHDPNMQHLFARLALSRSGAPQYVAAMARHHGAEGEAAARRLVAGAVGVDALVERFPLTLAAADRAIAILGHNRTALDALGRHTTVPVYYLPLSTELPAPAARTERAGPCRLIVFGFIGPNRRLESVLRAMASLPAGAFVLDIYGEVERSVGLASLVRRLRLRGSVRVHGFVPTEVLAAALHRADLALNLRFPTMGEASASQLRIWSQGLPSLVTRVGWFADLPPDAVGFVEPDAEQESLVRHLLQFRRDPGPYRAAGLRGRAIAAEQHTPGAYAEGMLAIAGSGAVQHRRRGAIDLAQCASRALLSLMPPADARGVAPGFATAIADLLGPA